MDEHKEIDQNKPAIAAMATEAVFEKAIDKIGDAVSKYFSNIEKKIEADTKVEVEYIKSQRQLNLLSFGMLALVLIIATIVVLNLKDLPPAVNSILCFIAGYASVGIGGFIKKKPEQRQGSEE